MIRLVAGAFGTRAWMSELGRAGGSMTSPAKRTAARIDGRLGGRPQKQAGTRRKTRGKAAQDGDGEAIRALAITLRAGHLTKPLSFNLRSFVCRSLEPGKGGLYAT